MESSPVSDRRRPRDGRPGHAPGSDTSEPPLGVGFEEERGFVVVIFSDGRRVVARKLADYSKGWRWCTHCGLAYKSTRCPIHNWPLRKASRLWRRNSERIEVGEE